MKLYLQAVRAELRKLLTVRSTYYIYLIMLALELLFAFWIFGFKVDNAELAADGKSYLVTVITNGTYFLGIFPAFAATLLMTHEYRYSTILYAFTASRSRLRILLAKVKVTSLYAVVTTLLFAVIAASLALLGTHLAGHSLPAQSIPLFGFGWRLLFYGWGMVMFGLLLGTLVRNQVVAIVSLLVIPNVLEQIAALLLKSNAVYLPFTALSQVIGQANGGPSVMEANLAPGKAALVVLGYLAVGWAVAAILFVRRNAN